MPLKIRPQVTRSKPYSSPVHEPVNLQPEPSRAPLRTLLPRRCGLFPARLAPDQVGPSWYALRFWIELGQGHQEPGLEMGQDPPHRPHPATGWCCRWPPCSSLASVSVTVCAVSQFSVVKVSSVKSAVSPIQGEPVNLQPEPPCPATNPSASEVWIISCQAFRSSSSLASVSVTVCAVSQFSVVKVSSVKSAVR